MKPSKNGSQVKGANHKVRKLLGRAYLRANRIPEALEVYKSIHHDSPQDTDVLLVVGNLYRLARYHDAAARLMNMVLALIPGHTLALQLSEHLPVEKDDLACEGDPLAADAIERLAARLQSQTEAVLLDEIRSAADVLDQPGSNGVAHEQNDQALLPALIEINIRQARASGSIEIAEALQSLQINLSRQADDQWADDLLKDDLPAA